MAEKHKSIEFIKTFLFFISPQMFTFSRCKENLALCTLICRHLLDNRKGCENNAQRPLLRTLESIRVPFEIKFVWVYTYWLSCTLKICAFNVGYISIKRKFSKKTMAILKDETWLHQSTLYSGCQLCSFFSYP